MKVLVNINYYTEIEKRFINDKSKIDKAKINSTIKDSEIYLPKCLLLMSLFPFFGEFEKIITEIYNYSLNLVLKPFYINNLSLNDNDNKGKDFKRIYFLIINTFSETIKNKDINVPVDKIIENLLIELPVPLRGVLVKYFLNEEEWKIQQFEMNKLPLINVNLKIIFKKFDVK